MFEDSEQVDPELIDMVTETAQRVTAACHGAECTAETFAAANLVAQGVILINMAPPGFDVLVAELQGRLSATLVKAWKASGEQTWQG